MNRSRKGRARGGEEEPGPRRAPAVSDEGAGQKKRIVRLGDLECGSHCTITRLDCGRQLRRRLMDMGVVAGTPVQVERVAPLGDPIELKLKGFHLSLRRDEAGSIWVEVPEDEC